MPFFKDSLVFYCFEETCISTVIFNSMHPPLVASGEQPKPFFPLTEIMAFKFKYNSNCDILVQNSNLNFQPI